MENRQSYIRLLEERRDTNEKTVEQLYSKIETLLKETVDIKLEIEHLRKNTKREKSLRDLPSLVWRKIMGMLINPRNEINDLSLASEELDKLIHSVWEGRPELIRKENAFAILLTNFYLDRQDLLNCAETGSDELGMLASKTWHFLQNPKCDNIDLNSEEAIQDFTLEAERRKREQKIWTLFVGKSFIFRWRAYSSPSWKIMKELLFEYENYFVHIQLLEAQRLDSYSELLQMFVDGKLQNLRFFFVHLHTTEFYALLPETNMRSMQTFFLLWVDMNNCSILNRGRLVVPLKIAEGLHDRCFSPGLKTMKTMRLWEFEFNVYYNPDNIKNVLSLHSKTLPQISQVTIPTLPSVASTFRRLVANFPALSTLNMNGRKSIFPTERERLAIPENFAIPTVRTFTYEWEENETFLSLRHLCAAFPSLRCFNMKTRLHGEQLLDSMRLVLDRDGNADDRDYDVFQRICDNQSLAESNIWEQVPRLNIISLITRMEELEVEMKYWMMERYIRAFREVCGGGSSIRFERYPQTDWKLEKYPTWFY